MSAFSQIQPFTLRDIVVEQVRTAIIEGHLRPTDHIVESELTKQLGVSRTPVREALILLEREGLVVSLPNRGSFVREIGVDDVDGIFAMRSTLETFAAELLLDRFDDADAARLTSLIDLQHHQIEGGDDKSVRSTDMMFHQHLVERADNPLLLRSWKELVAQVAAVLYLRADGFPDYDEYRATADHRKILAAYQSGELAAIRSEHQRINRRVAEECKAALRTIGSASA